MELTGQESFRGAEAHVIGAARSGLAAAEVLGSLGARVTLHDQKEAMDLAEEIESIRGSGFEIRVGTDAYTGIDTADLIVTSPGVPDTCPALLLARESGIPILPEIELAYRISAAPILAVTGTNGKTTTTALVGEMLRCDGRRVYLAGNIVAGDIRMPLVQAAFDASESDVIVAEISSFQLEWISSFRPMVGALLNISPDHMDRHPDMETYARMKARLFIYQRVGDIAVLNADDPRVMEIASSVKSGIWKFSRTSEVDRGTFIRGSEIWVRISDGDQQLCDTSTMRLRGTHNVENILAASAMVLAFGGDRDCIQPVVDSFQPLEHRLELVTEIHGVEFLNNSMCTNVAAAVRSLEAIGRRAIVIAGGKDKGSDYTPVGDAFNRHAKHVVLIGKDAGLIEQAARKAGFDQISHAESLEQAVEAAWQHAEAGDTVVLSPGCASFDMFRDFEHRGQAFNEAVLALADRVGAER